MNRKIIINLSFDFRMCYLDIVGIYCMYLGEWNVEVFEDVY